MQTLNEQLKQLMKRKKLSFATVSKSLGIARSRLNMWMNDNYPGDTEKIENAVRVYIEREKLREGKSSIDFVQIAAARIIFEVAETCHVEGQIGVCYGGSGIGKTFAVKEYARLNSDVILIEADLGYTAKVLFSEIHKKLGLEGTGDTHSMMLDIIDKLKDSGRLIIVDEAEHLPYKSLELLRRLHDKAEVGILLTGMPRLIENLVGKKRQYVQLYSRVGISQKLYILSEEDIKLIVNSVLPGKDHLLEAFSTFCMGNTRILSKIITRAIAIAEINNEPITQKVVAKASEILFRGGL